MFLLTRILVLAAALLFLPAANAATGRVALVIGNAKYAAAGTLANPVNDAEDIAARLRQLGFKVVDGYDLGKRDMELKIGEFADALEGAETGLFYYAGHGVAVGGRNFVLPVDAHLDQPAKLKLEAMSADDIVELMGQQVKTSLIILDACRNNPFARSLSTLAKTRGVQASEGLAEMEGASGSFIAFSTKPGYTAMDGSGRNSPFAAALLKRMGEPGVEIGEMMRKVRNDVLAATHDFQRPQWSDDLPESFSFKPAAVVPPAPVKALPPVRIASLPGEVDPRVIPEVTPEAVIEHLITGLYLKTTPDKIEAYVRRMYAEKSNSFGYGFATLDALVAGKVAYLAQYKAWDTTLVPGTLQVTVFDANAATATFNQHWHITPKTGTAFEGVARATLEFIMTPDGWRISKESSVAVK